LAIALRGTAKPRCDVRQVIRETFTAPRRDVADELHRARVPAAAHERLAVERGMHRRPERPVAHPARFELLSRLVQEPHRATRIAAPALHDAADEVAEVLVGREALRRAGQDALRDLGLTAQQGDVGEVLRRAGAALATEPIAGRDLATLHPAP